MKVINEMQIQQVSGAGFMADNGWSGFLDVQQWSIDNHATSLDLLSLRPAGGGASDVKDSFLSFCKQNNLDAVATAKMNGWSL